MCHESRTGSAQWHPQILSATAHAPDLLTEKVIPQGALVPANSSRMEHLYVGDDPAGNPSIETTPDDLDLRKFRHVSAFLRVR